MLATEILAQNKGTEPIVDSPIIDPTPIVTEERVETATIVNGAINQNVTVTSDMPREYSDTLHLPPYMKFHKRVHYKRALMMMMGYSSEEIIDKLNINVQDAAMLTRLLSWNKSYSIVYYWDKISGEVEITEAGAELLNFWGLIHCRIGNKIVPVSEEVWRNIFRKGFKNPGETYYSLEFFKLNEPKNE